MFAPFVLRQAQAAPAGTRKSAAPPFPAPERKIRLRDGELIIRFREDAAEQDRNSLIAIKGAKRDRKLRGKSGLEKLRLAAGKNPETVAAELRQNPLVEIVEPNYLISRDEIVPDDPHLSEQWALRNTGQNGGQVTADINAAMAWEITTGSPSTIIAVVDSGIDFTHPDLTNNQWTNAAEQANGIDDDHNGLVDDLHGWDWVARSNQIKDEQGHGTAMAGLIAAEGNNATGTTGVMWRASLMSLRVLDSTGTGDVAQAVEAIDYAVANGATIINCSWGTDGESTILREAIQRAAARQVLVVSSAGNGARDIDGAPYYPASFDLPNVISVTATNNFDQLAPGSDWGAARVTVAAPGTELMTTKMGGGSQTVSGTSASTALVSGVAGLIRTARPRIGVADTKAALINGSRRVTDLTGKVSAGGVVSASGALGAMQGADIELSPTPTPTPDATPIPSPTPGDGDGGSGDTGGDGGAEVGATEPAGTLGAPGANLPNLDRAREIENVDPVAPEPIHSDLPCLTCGDGDSEPPPPPPPTGGGTGGGGGGTTSSDPELSTPRTDPANQTGQPGVDLGSRNYNWSIPLVSLPGRSGMGLGITLYYNSLVWVREGNTIRFNTDRGFPGPGFRLGFPTIQQRYYNSQVGVWSYLLVNAAGGTVEMRQVGTTNVYESADSSYTQMTEDGAGGGVVRVPDGTEMTFAPAPNGQMRCTKIMDRNGNYVSAAYDGQGRLSAATDTLGRVITFLYNAYGLGAIRQMRTNDNGGAYTYTWATFTYSALTLQPNFPGLTVQGPQGSTFNVPSEIGLADGSSYKFDYTSFGQVWKISHSAADDGLLNYVSYNLSGSPINASSAQTDCPRFSSKQVWARDWNGDTDGVPAASEESGTGYEVDAGGAWTKVYTPDGTCHAQQFATSGWRKGLPTGTETWIPGQSPVKVRWTTTAWTQDDETLSYQKNPRVVENIINDDSGNRRRTTITHHPASMFNLVKDVKDYAAGGTSVLRTTHYEYNLNTNFTNRRIIGLVSEQTVYKGDISAGVLAAKEGYEYDELSGLLVYQGAPVQHSATYNTTNTTTMPRGNLTSVRRFNVEDQADVVETNIAYNTAGSVIFTRDALQHKTTISYADAYYSDATAHNSLAYPTSITDADGYKSTTEYDYDTGLVRKTHVPSGGTGASITYVDQLMDYDSAGRIIKRTNLNNNSYAKWVYPTTQLLVQQYRMVQNGQGLAYTGRVADGAGRTRGTFSELPDATGFYTGQRVNYDAMGRAMEQSNPTTMDGATWVPRGDDQTTGWYWTKQQYDWKGRPTLTTNQDASARTVSYDGCGCAGSEAATYTDERGRQRRLTNDVLGRLSKVEELNWDAAHSVYATTTYTYDVLDHMTQINQGGQLRKFIYDGHGRLESRATPEQGTTKYSYNADDTVNAQTDARNVTATFSYTNRQMVKSINYTVPTGVAETPDLTFTYDAAGHHDSMTEALPGKTVGKSIYDYDDLGQMVSETRSFGDETPAPAPVTLSYEYNWGGELTKMTSSLGQEVGYVYDRIGRMTKITGAGYAGITSYIDTVDYRAFGGVKTINYSNGKSLAVTYTSRMRTKRWNVAGVLGWDYNYSYFGENTGRVTYADSLNDPKLDRSYDYDQVGRLAVSYTGTSARGHVGLTQTWVADGAYAGDAYRYDQWGNMTERVGWYKDQAEGFIGATYTETFNAKNQLTKNPATGATMLYDLAGNLKNDGTWALTYDATGQQTEGRSGGVVSLIQSYDGDRLRVKKVENGVTTYYVRSSMLGGQVVAELDESGQHKRGYVYMGEQLVAMQENNVVTWVHQDPVTKSQRFTNSAGVLQSQRVDLDPWGVETNRSVNSQMQPRRFTSYERDANGSDEAMHRRYNSARTRFDQPDPYDGSYDLTNPQSFNRYSYVKNDPVNFIDPSGLQDSWNCGPQYSSCGGGAGSGGAGYSGTPFDNSFFNNPFGDVDLPEHMAVGVERYEKWLQQKRKELAEREAAKRLFKALINGTGGGMDGYLSHGGIITSLQHAEALEWTITLVGGGGAIISMEGVAIVVVGAAAVAGLIYILNSAMASSPPNAAVNGNINSTGNKQREKVISGLLSHIFIHLGKINSTPPNDPDQDGWRKEIRAAADRIKNLARRLGGKRKKEIMDTISDIESQL